MAKKSRSKSDRVGIRKKVNDLLKNYNGTIMRVVTPGKKTTNTAFSREIEKEYRLESRDLFRMLHKGEIKETKCVNVSEGFNTLAQVDTIFTVITFYEKR